MKFMILARSVNKRILDNARHMSLPVYHTNLTLGTRDNDLDDYRILKDEKERNNRDFVYYVNSLSHMTYAATVRFGIVATIASMAPTADVLAVAQADYDISDIAEGSTLTVKWRGKPVFIRHRPEAEIHRERTVDLSTLRQPQSDADRATNPEWLVVVGVCTHLGCVPISGAGDFGGWFCPCHGSHYDASGRIRKGPAPDNLEVPPYTLRGNHLTIG